LCAADLLDKPPPDEGRCRERRDVPLNGHLKGRDLPGGYTTNTSGICFEMPRSTPVTMRCWQESQWWS
jgi:hypothetical protein